MTLGQHDDWMPPLTRDMTNPDAMAPVKRDIARMRPGTELLELPCRSRYVVFE